MWLCGYSELCASRPVGGRLLISRSSSAGMLLYELVPGCCSVALILWYIIIELQFIVGPICGPLETSGFLLVSFWSRWAASWLNSLPHRSIQKQIEKPMVPAITGGGGRNTFFITFVLFSRPARASAVESMF